MLPPKRTFHELLRETRLGADQTPEVMAVLLNMSVEEYEALEGWKYPDEDTLKRLCMMMEWNYYDTQRLIINEMISPNRPASSMPPAQQSVPKAVNSVTPQAAEQRSTQTAGTLGERLREVRLVTGQSTEIIALMLNIEEEEYLRIEEGAHPSDEVLRRISMVYTWNYQDLNSVLRTEHARRFQPTHVGMPYLGSTAQLARFRQLTKELEALFLKLSDADQQMGTAQLELIRDTMLRHQRAS